MRITALVLFLLIPFGFAPGAEASPEGDQGWPTEVTFNGARIVVYQPQADSWKKNHLEARSAVTVTAQGSSKALYGIVTLAARTDVDKESRVVTLEELKINSASFPAAQRQQSELLKALRESLPQWPTAISLDRLLADLSIAGAEMDTDSVQVKNQAPQIIFSTMPSVLITIDGQPFYRAVPGTPYTRVMNTPALLLFRASAGRFYLDGGDRWMTATQLNGRWSALSNAPADLSAVKDQITKTESSDPHNHSHDPGMPSSDGPPPTVYICTHPAELIQTQGPPQFAPLPNTQLVYATNTENDLFMDIKSQAYFILLAGRWYQSMSLNGPWNWVPGKQLPGDFRRIPRESPKGRVLASIPGTDEAKEAAIATQIPQTATVERKKAKLAVSYDGNPQFKAIEGTGMEYAVNSPDDVIQAEGRYYAVQNAVWFVADAPFGPWGVADFVPPVIYSIPPSCPLFHDRFVYVYGATPDYVYMGYTPGYLGAYDADGVVVFGTGWDYPAWYGAAYYGWPWTWGFGWRFGYWGGGWFDRPVGYSWWYHDPPYFQRVYYNRFNPHWHPADYEAFRNNVNVYNRWGPNAVLSRNRTTRMAARNALARRNMLRQSEVRQQSNPGFARNIASREDLYAGRDGRVYQYRRNGWFQQGGTANWNRVQANPRLEMQRQSRVFGGLRSDEFRGYRGFSGMASRPGGFSSMPRTYPSGFGARAGGFPARGGGFRR